MARLADGRGAHDGNGQRPPAGTPARSGHGAPRFGCPAELEGDGVSTPPKEVAETNGAPRPRSSAVFDGPDRAFARAYLKGIGFGDDDLRRPTVGIANTWIEAMPCNFHLRGLAEHVKEGVRAAGG